MTSDGIEEKCLVYSTARPDHGLDPKSFEPKTLNIRRNDPVGDPTVRFMFHKVCPHYDILAHHGQPYHFYLKIGDEERYFESDGYWWWCDVSRQELGKFENGDVFITYIEKFGLDKRDTKGLSRQEVKEKKGWRSWSMNHVARWKVV
jgi:hypothetical protein